MRKIDTSFITSSVGMPIKSGTLDHLQLSYQEALSALAQSIIGNYTTGVVYILTGCENSGTGSTFNISQGYVYYNGEVFFVPAASFTAVNTAVFDSIQTSYFVATNADPVEFTDGNNQNVHQIRTINIIDAVSGSGISDYADAVTPEWQYSPITSAIFTSGTGTFTSGQLIYKRSGNTMILNFNLIYSLLTLGLYNQTAIQIDLPVPKAPDLSLNDVVNAAVGVTINSASNVEHGSGYSFIASFVGGLNKLEIYTQKRTALSGTASVYMYGQIIYPI